MYILYKYMWKSVTLSTVQHESVKFLVKHHII